MPSCFEPGLENELSPFHLQFCAAVILERTFLQHTASQSYRLSGRSHRSKNWVPIGGSYPAGRETDRRLQASGTPLTLGTAWESESCIVPNEAKTFSDSVSPLAFLCEASLLPA